MKRLASLAAILLVSVAILLAANFKLYLKDGGFHIVREYQKVEDRLKYYSVERGDWEEIPLDLVDLKKTEAEVASRQELDKEEKKIQVEEDNAERDLRKEKYRVPGEPGVYWVESDEKIAALKQAELKVVTNKKRTVLKAISPLPFVAGKATVEIDGLNATFTVTSERPEFYFRLVNEERFAIIRLTPAKISRVVEKWSIIPVSNEVLQEQNQVEIFRRQMDDGLYKIWPVQAMEPGEYAVVEYTEGKRNTQVWDFRCKKPLGK